MSTPRERLKAAILRAVSDRMAPTVTFDHSPRGGLATWKSIRRHVGGRITSAELRAAIEDLLGEGRLLEMRFAPHGDREGPHLFVLPAEAFRVRRRVLMMRGQRPN